MQMWAWHEAVVLGDVVAAKLIKLAVFISAAF
jgi:hypothetical protein